MIKTTSFTQRRTLSALAFAGVIALAGAASVVGLNVWAAGSETARGAAHEGMRCHVASSMGMGMAPMGGRHLAHLLDQVKATDAQRQEIKLIEQAAQNDLKAVRDSSKSLHEQAMALMVQPQVDPVAAEKLRQQMLAGHDLMSKRMLQAMLDIAKVLTPAQRTQMAETMKKHHEKMGHGGSHQ